MSETLDGFSKRVRAFHKRNNFALEHNIADASEDGVLWNIGGGLKSLADSLLNRATHEQHRGDERFWRVMLALEELGEWIQALAKADELEAADAIADRLFILLGDAETYGLPIAYLLNEVCDSNDSKATRRAEDSRMRDKGEHYRPPDIAGALERGRGLRAWEKSLQNEG